MKQLIISMLLCCFVHAIQGQGWMRTYNKEDSYGYVGRSYSTYDEGQMIVSNVRDTNWVYHRQQWSRIVKMTKTNQHGDVAWIYNYPLASELVASGELSVDSSHLVVHQDVGSASPLYVANVQLSRISKSGVHLYDTVINAQYGVRSYINPYGSHRSGRSDNNVIVTRDDHVVFANNYYDSVANEFGIQLTKIDPYGNLIWQKRTMTDTVHSNHIGHMVESSNGQFYLHINDMDSLLRPTKRIHHFDALGNWVWSRTITSPRGDLNLWATPDGGVLAGLSGLDSLPVVIKYSASNTELWQHQLPPVNSPYMPYFISMVNNPDGSYTLVLRTMHHRDAPTTLHPIRLNDAGQTQWLSPIQTGQQGLRVGLYMNRLSGYYRLVGHCKHGEQMIVFDSLGRVYTNRITGYLYHDNNQNCEKDSTETAWLPSTLAFYGTRDTFFASTDTTGYYEAWVDTGQFIIAPTGPQLPYRYSCVYPPIDFGSYYNQTDTVDIGYGVLDSCAYMEVNIAASFLRRCFDSYYRVEYHNHGTQTADSARIEVQLDPYLTYVSSSIPLSRRVGQVLYFELGDVAPMGRGRFGIRVQVDCDSTALGQVHCTEARISPDTLCSDPWLGPNIEVSSICRNDSVFFRLLNTGAAMSQPRQYVVIEEHVMILQAPFQLAANAHVLVGLPTLPGKLYRIEAQQASGFPATLGDPSVVHNRFGCQSLRAVLGTPNILGQFYNGNTSPFVSVDCQPNIGAYDPNDKHAQPEGYGPQHYIEKNTPIDYRIRFQNTGTDTAFTVVIVDTLDSDLDPSTLQMGVSSHPYTWSLSSSGVLTVRYDNIQLPDSNVNEPLSHGFIKFKINQDPNLPDGTELTNQAGIYFDFNAPIITNEVFHTIGSNFKTVRLTGLDQPLVPQVQVHCYPNPWRYRTTLQVEGATYQELRVEVYNAVGQQIQTFQTTGSDRLVLDRGRLQGGIYWYRLIGDGQPIATGKMVVQ